MSNKEKYNEILKEVTSGDDYYSQAVKGMQAVDLDDEIIAGCNLCGECCRNRTDIALKVSDVRNLQKGLGISFEELVSYLDIYIAESGFPNAILNYLGHKATRIL